MSKLSLSHNNLLPYRSFPLLFIYGLRAQEDIPRSGARCSHRGDRPLAHEQAIGGAVQGRLPQKLQQIDQTLRTAQDSRHRGKPEGVADRTAGPVFMLHSHREANQLSRPHRVPQ